MSLISPAELAEIQSIARSGMTSTATILVRSTLVTDDGQESVWATSGDDVPCWVHQITPDAGTLSGISGAVGISQTVNIRVPVTTVVTPGDRIAVGSTVYDVQSMNDSDTYPAFLEVACRVIQ